MNALTRVCSTLVVTILFILSCEKPTPEGTGRTDIINANRPPIAIAGADTTIFLPMSVLYTFHGSGSDPDYSQVRLEWRQINGPDLKHFRSIPEWGRCNVEFGVEGNYEFELTARDALNATGKDTLKVNVVWSSDCGKEIRDVPLAFSDLGPASPDIPIDATVASSDQYLIFAGGARNADTDGWGTKGDFSQELFYFNMITREWKVLSLTAPRLEPAVSVSGHIAIIAGGQDSIYETSDRVEIFDLRNGKLITAKLSKGRAFATTASDGNKVYFFGGVAGEVSDVVDIYDISHNIWTTSRMPVPRSSMMVAVFNGKIFLAGGSELNRISDRVDILDIATGQWTLARLPRPMQKGAANVFNGAISHTGLTAEGFNVVSHLDPGSLSFSEGCMAEKHNFNEPGLSPISLSAATDGRYLYNISNFYLSRFDPGSRVWSRGKVPASIYPTGLFSAGGKLYVILHENYDQYRNLSRRSIKEVKM